VDAFYAAYRIVQRANRVAVTVACVFIVLMVVFTDWEAFTRYFLRDPAMWTYPVTSYLLLYSMYLAMGYTLQKGGHVSVEFAVELLPDSFRRWLERISHVLGFGFVLVFLYQSYRLFARHLAEGQKDISVLSLPLSLVSFGLVLGLALMAVTYVFVVVDAFLRGTGERTLQEQERARRAPDEQLD
jgi:TRAP-type C4-dicarboxylate transport system permease small subunit